MVFNMKELNQAHELMSICEANILQQTGLKVRLKMVQISLDEVKMEDMLELIAEILGMSYSDYIINSRKPQYVTLRTIGSLFIKRYYPDVTYAGIGVLFGQHHSSVIVGLRRGENFLEISDNVFTSKYQQVESAVLRLFKKK